MTDATALDLYVINLDHRSDRRSWMTSQADRLGLTLSFFSAVNGTKNPEALQSNRFATSGPLGRFGPGDMACTLSHLKLYESFLNSGKSHCAVFEDDAQLADDLANWVWDISWIPADADLVKFEVFVQRGLMVLLGRPVLKHLSRSLHPILSRHTGGAGYIISRTAAQRVLDHREPINVPIDHLLFNANISPLARGFTAYQIVPALVYQNEEAGTSDLIVQRGEPMSATSYWLRELRRAYHEISRLPVQLWMLATQGARLKDIPWQSKADADPSEPVHVNKTVT